MVYYYCTNLPNKSLLKTTPMRSFPKFHHHDCVKGSIDSRSDRGASKLAKNYISMVYKVISFLLWNFHRWWVLKNKNFVQKSKAVNESMILEF